jgi:hypothetical protein
MNRSVLHVLLGVAAVALVFVVIYNFGGKVPYPDESIIEWNCGEDSAWRAVLKASEIKGKFYKVSPTGSMEPFLTGGDYIVVDTQFPFSGLKERDVAAYNANWLPAGSTPVSHMVAKKYSNGSCIMIGIANSSYENGSRSMTEKDYIGKMVKGYTKRPKPTP